MTTTRVQSPRWLSLLSSILEACENDTALAPATNDETFKRGLGWLERLMKKEALSPKQAANFIDSIRKRVPGKSDFTWTGTIALTPKQIADEKRNQTMRRFQGVNRKKQYAVQLMMEAVQDVVEEFDFSDLDKLAAFRAHILAFDHNSVEATIEEVVAELEPLKPTGNAVLDSMMSKHPRVERFPSNRWNENRVADVHSPLSTLRY